MDHYVHDVTELVDITGVKRKYIDRMYEIMPVLETYRKKSPELNKYFYNSGAVDIFHRIYQLKELGLNRREIKEQLEEDGLGSMKEPQEESSEAHREGEGSRQGGYESVQSVATNPSTEVELIKALRESHAQALKVYEDMVKTTLKESQDLREQNKELRTENKDLRESILLALPGKVEKAPQELPHSESNRGEGISTLTHSESL